MNRQAAEQAGPGTIVEGSAAVTSRANPFAALLPSVSPSTALRLAGLLIFPVLVAFGVDFRDAFHAMRTASPGFVIAALVVIQLTFIARAWRWQLFVEATGMRGVGARFVRCRADITQFTMHRFRIGRFRTALPPNFATSPRFAPCRFR